MRHALRATRVAAAVSTCQRLQRSATGASYPPQWVTEGSGFCRVHYPVTELHITDRRGRSRILRIT